MSEQVSGTSEGRVEYGRGNPVPQKPDFFLYENKDPNFHYHWASSNPRRVQQLKREGYEVVSLSSSADAQNEVKHQRESLKRQLNDPDVSEANKKMAKVVLDMMDKSPMGTELGIPEHVLMRIPMAERIKRMQKRQDILKSQEDAIEQNIHELDIAMKRSGKGGIEAFRELFDRIDERNNKFK